MAEVERSALQRALKRHTTDEHAKELMDILEPLYRMCAYEHFFYGHSTDIPEEIPEAIELLTQHPCSGIEFVAESIIPARLIRTPQNSNFIRRTRLCLEQRVVSYISVTHAFNLNYDMRYSFGTRLQSKLPGNLWNQLWESIRYWLLCEIAGDAYKQEADALRKIVRMCVGGNIIFDQKPNDPRITYVVNAKDPAPDTRFRWQ